MAVASGWIEVLNEQTTWKSPADLVTWFSSLTGRALSPDAEAVAEFQNALAFIRQQATALHFRETLDVAGIDVRLSVVALTFAPVRAMPTLRARAPGDSDADVLKALENTLLVQFAEFAGQCLDSNYAVDIARCEGVYRESTPNDPEYVNPFEAHSERRWRNEIPILSEAGLIESEQIERCCDFFVLRPKARFCSEECRFRSFQLNKQLSDPGYLAAKQKRYRQRQAPKNSSDHP